MSSELQTVTAGQAMQMAMQHHEEGRLAEAESIYRSVLDANPDNADAIHLLGVIAHQRAQNDVAVELIEKAVKLNPHNPFALNNLGEAYRALGCLDHAQSAYSRALQLKEDYAEAHSNLGNVLCSLGRYTEAEQSYRQALQLNPLFAKAGLNYSLLQLLRGDYANGFRLFENRFNGGNPQEIGAATEVLRQLGGTRRWQGERLATGEVLLVWTEQGFGDSLMMMRYLPLLKDLGVGCIDVYCDPALVRIMQMVAGVDTVISSDRPVPIGTFDCHCPIMSLPLLFQTRLETIPRDVPYLEVAPQLRRQWADKLAAVARPRVGMAWAGGKSTQSDKHRSIPLQCFAPLFDLGGATFISLQKGEEARQAAESRWKILDWMHECTDFLDTAALIEQLDLVISVDTAVAHLAGALGKPVWLLNRYESEWRWMLQRGDSPWYPTMRIFRQSARANWDAEMDTITAALSDVIKKPGGGRPVSAHFPSSGAEKKSLWNRWISKLEK